MKEIQKNEIGLELQRYASIVAVARSRFIPSTMTNWANGPPPAQWRLPIDEELRLLARRHRRPIIRSNSAIFAEFPTLNWDGPYHAARFFLFNAFLINPPDDSAYWKGVSEKKDAQLKLIRELRKSIQVYVDKIRLVKDSFLNFDMGSEQETEFITNLSYLQNLTIYNLDVMEKILQEAKPLRETRRGGRPPNIRKTNFVSGLGNLWRIMTGDQTSKDPAAPFASFVTAAWESLGGDLPETTWTSQIRRRKDLSSAADLVEWANSIREFALERADLGRNPDKT